jgi:hypothetical protein
VSVCLGGLGGLGVRLRRSSPATVSTPLVLVLFASAKPLTFGDLGGLDRRDRGVGVTGGELLLETGLMPLLSVKDEAY